MREQRQRQRDVQRRRDTVDQPLETASEDPRDHEEEREEGDASANADVPSAAHRQKLSARRCRIAARQRGDEEQQRDADDPAVQLAPLTQAMRWETIGGNRPAAAVALRGSAPLNAANRSPFLSAEHAVPDFDPSAKVAEDVAHHQRAVRHRDDLSRCRTPRTPSRTWCTSDARCGSCRRNARCAWQFYNAARGVWYEKRRGLRAQQEVRPPWPPVFTVATGRCRSPAAGSAPNGRTRLSHPVADDAVARHVCLVESERVAVERGVPGSSRTSPRRYRA